MASLVGLRERRERVIAKLTQCYERDLLDIDELDRLLGQAHAATTLVELDALVAGLGETTTALGLAQSHEPRLEKKYVTVMFSNFERIRTGAPPLKIARGDPISGWLVRTSP